MDDDFNTAGALGAFFGFITDANSYLDAADGAVDTAVVVAAAELIERSMDVLGIELPEQEAELPAEIVALAAERAGYLPFILKLNEARRAHSERSER